MKKMWINGIRCNRKLEKTKLLKTRFNDRNLINRINAVEIAIEKYSNVLSKLGKKDWGVWVKVQGN